MIYIDENVIGEAAETLTGNPELAIIITDLLKLPPEKLEKVRSLISNLIRGGF